MTVRRVVLWDIDGTLMRAGAVAREVFDLAFRSVLGRAPGDHRIVMSGKTDPQIAAEILAFAAVAEPEASGRVPAILEHLEHHLTARVEELRTSGRVLPGVREVLAALHDDAGVHQTLLTGNTAGNARTKTAAFGLDRWLDLDAGAYGSDDADRLKLVPVALERLRVRRHLHVDPDQVWVVGDTERDLACARAGGARCLLVGTGRTPAEELRRTDADVVLEDLSDTGRVIDALTS